MIIKELEDKDCLAWDAYVKSAPGGLPQHLSGWRDVMSKTYGFDMHYQMALEQGQVVGVMPLFLVRSLVVGSSATTMPGGLCADNAEIATALIARGQEIARQAKVNQLVLQDTRQIWPGNLQTATNHMDWKLDVSGGVEACRARLKRKSQIDRETQLASENGIRVESERTGKRLGEFYNILSQFTWKAGTPVFSRMFLEQVVKAFPHGFVIYILSKEGRPIGGQFSLILGDTVYFEWGATLHEYLSQGSGYLLYWQVIQDLVRNGYHYWDLGRSPIGSNAANFKAKWGSVSSPVYQQVAAIGKEQVTGSMTTRVQSNSSFRRFTQIWPKLPFPVVQVFGPKLRRHVPFA